MPLWSDYLRKTLCEQEGKILVCQEIGTQKAVCNNAELRHLEIAEKKEKLILDLLIFVWSFGGNKGLSLAIIISSCLTFLSSDLPTGSDFKIHNLIIHTFESAFTDSDILLNALLIKCYSQYNQKLHSCLSERLTPSERIYQLISFTLKPILAVTSRLA